MNDKIFLNSAVQPTAGQPSFVAIGDSFTEGMNDAGPDGNFVGWADRLADLLAAEHSDLRYANLAIRGKLLRQIVDDQVPAAAAMRPGLVSIAGGGNDILRPGSDPDALAELFDGAVSRLRASGAQVLMFTGFDPAAAPVLRLLRGRIGTYNMHLRAIADAHGCYLVDLWSMRFFRSADAWSPDRLHLSGESHLRVALRAGEVLGVPVPCDWREPLPDDLARTVSGPPTVAPVPVGVDSSRAAWVAARREDARWAKEYLGPWIGRRLRGVSSGDGRTAKRPALEPLSPPVSL
jgi:lysophospholipase L1-like esterase